MTTTNGHRRATFGSGLNHGTHFTQWIGHTVHRALGQGRIAGQGGVEALSCQQAGQQAHRSTRVAQVDRARWRFQTVQANAMNGHATMMRALNHHAHVTERLQRRQGIFTLKETFHFGRTFSQRAEHDRAVGNGFVAWYANSASYLTTRICQKNQIVGIHSVHICPAGQDFTEMLAGNPGAREDAQQLMPIPCIDRVAQGVEITAKCIQCAQHCLAVREKNVMPHYRVAAGDSCEITEATRCVTEDIQILVALGKRIHQPEGQ